MIKIRRILAFLLASLWMLVLWRIDAHADGITGHEEYIVTAAQEHSIDPDLLAAVAALESGWGRSALAVNRNNLFGWMGDNGRYMEFTSFAACADYVAGVVGRRPHGTPEEIAEWYQPEDPEAWAQKINEIMEMIDNDAHF